MLGVLEVLAVLGVLAVPAAAQERGYVTGGVGSASAEATDTSYHGLGAWRLNHRLDLFGEVGRLRNALGTDLSATLAATAEAIRATNLLRFGQEFPVVFDARVPAWYGVGGVRARMIERGRLAAFVDGGFGTARLDPQVHLTINGDNLDSEVEAITGLGENTQELAFAAAAGGGVSLALWKRVRIEGGYRYLRFFGDAAVNINVVRVGAGWTF